jgi:hypothetical protein
MTAETFTTTIDDTHIPAHLRELVKDRLTDGETIRWIDMPIPHFFSLGSSIAFVIGIYLVAVSVVFLYVATAVGMRHPEPMPEHEHQMMIAFALIPYLLFALPFLSVPLWTYRKTKRTVYAITNLRAITVQGIFSTLTVASYYPTDLGNLSCKQRANGTGNLVFKIDGGCFFWSIRRGFWNIRNVGNVERMMQELKNTKPQEHEQ